MVDMVNPQDWRLTARNLLKIDRKNHPGQTELETLKPVITFKKNSCELTKASRRYLKQLDPSIRTTPYIIDGRKFYPLWMTPEFRATLPRWELSSNPSRSTAPRWQTNGRQ
jgi:hypothetical protein